MLPELIAYHPSLAYLIDQQYTKSVDEILAVRKPLPFVDEEEMKRQMKEEDSDHEEKKQPKKEEKKIRFDEDDENSESEDYSHNMIMKEELKEYKSSKEVQFEEKKELAKKPITHETSTLDIILKAKALQKERLQKRNLDNEPESAPKEEEYPTKKIKTSEMASIFSYFLQIGIDLDDLIKHYDEMDKYQKIESSMKPLTEQMTQLYEIHPLLSHYNPEVMELSNKLKSGLVKTRTNIQNYLSRTYFSFCSKSSLNSRYKGEFDKYFKSQTSYPHEFKHYNKTLKEDFVVSSLFSIDFE